ncbi:hypothetical protein DFH07DRAFT_689420, partial [Mycena maculata]
KMRGIIYGGQSHFTCRFVSPNGSIWFNDGISTGSECIPDGNIHDTSSVWRLNRCGQKHAVAVIYAR